MINRIMRHFIVVMVTKISVFLRYFRKVRSIVGLASNTKNRALFFTGQGYSNQLREKSKKPGCNLLGYAFGEFGMGEHVKSIARSCLASEIPVSIYNYQQTHHKQGDRTLEPLLDQNNPHNTNLFCINNDAVLNLYAEDAAAFKGRYNIGYGQWELSEYPNDWLFAMNVLDEVWAPTKYVADIISRKSSVPVVLMPLAVDFPFSNESKRSDFSIPEDKFIFLFSFDFSSTIARKNPYAVVEAFKKAFGQKSHVLLVLKCKVYKEIKSQRQAYEAMMQSLVGVPNIMVIDQSLTRSETLSLLNCADCYISLHRAEGFGFGMAESMKLGKPVIATGYSGNMEFMNHTNSFPVDYTLTPVKQGEFFNLEGRSVWAEPDVDHAVSYMEKVVEDSALAASIGKKGKKTIDERFNNRIIGMRYQERLKFIGLL